MGTRMQMLVVSVLLLTAGVVGCSSTTSAPAGAVQDETVASASAGACYGPGDASAEQASASAAGIEDL